MTGNQLLEVAELSKLLGLESIYAIPLDLAFEICSKEDRKRTEPERARWALRWHAKRCGRCLLQACSREDILCKTGGRIAKRAGLEPAVILDW